MDMRGFVAGTMMLSWVALVVLPGTSSAADISAWVGAWVERVLSLSPSDTHTTELGIWQGTNGTQKIIVGRVESVIFSTGKQVPKNQFTGLVESVEKIWRADVVPENTTQTESLADMKATVHGFLSVASGNTQISLVQKGLRLQYNNSLKAELTKEGPSIQLDHAFLWNRGAIKAEVRKGYTSVRYTHSF